MTKLSSSARIGTFVVLATMIGVPTARYLLAGRALAEEGKSADFTSVTKEHDSVNLDAHHHYQSQADRANDALLVTEVKSAIADDGVAEDSVIVVDCDHGTILLSGVMRSAEDAQRAAKIAASASGVVGVRNRLTWH
jgi:osmotically-inducible protein OsmY